MSIFDHPDTVSAAAFWRCPECRTLQAQTTQCWRCAKAVYACETCHLFRPSVAAGIGYCANDPSREPIRADETRSCWEVAAAPTEVPGLFDEPPAMPPQPMTFQTAAASVPALRSAPDSARRPAPARPLQRVRPPLEEPGRAAWVEPEPDQLVDAPTVEPGASPTTERHRRARRRWFG